MRKNFWWVKKVLFLLVGIPALFAGPMLVEIGYQAYYGEEAYLISGNATGIPMILCLAVVLAYGWLPGVFRIAWLFGGRDARAVLSKRKRFLAAGIILCIALAGMAGSMCFFDKFTADGVESVRFANKREYRWQDTDYFTLKADSHGMLVFEAAMKDGRHYSFNGGILRWVEYESDAFEQQFPEGAYDYILYLGKKLKGYQVPMYVEDWDRMIKDLDYKYWKELAGRIWEIYHE